VHYWADSGLLQADSYVLTTRASRFFPHVGDLGVWANAAYVMIHPAPRSGTCTPHDPASKNTGEIINGYHVVVKRMTIGGLPEQEVCAAHADGLWVDIEEFGPHPTIGVTSLFKHLRLLGANPANWTSNPIGCAMANAPARTENARICLLTELRSLRRARTDHAMPRSARHGSCVWPGPPAGRA